ncbi:unnamed protein product, partial [Ixodes persulcatus]
YPQYVKGNPQLRIFLPNFWMKLVKHGKPQPPNTVKFVVPLQMTKYDVKNYLEKIYKVPVAQVKTFVMLGTQVLPSLFSGPVWKAAEFLSRQVGCTATTIGGFGLVWIAECGFPCDIYAMKNITLA